MEISLKYSEKILWPTNAAYIPGNSPEEWFREIDRWQIDAKELNCYLVPESIRSEKNAGLFVTFNNKTSLESIELRFPYTQFAEGFYIPVNATLFPQVSQNELEALKLWPVQLFHPSIGLVGYDINDQIKLLDLVEIPQPIQNEWLQKLPSPRELPILQMISLEQDEQAVDAVDALKELIDTRPLSDIPNGDENSNKTTVVLNKILNAIATVGLSIILVLSIIIKLILDVLVFFIPAGLRPVRRTSSNSTGLFQKAEKWINEKLDNLQKKRDTELNRLVKLFDKDSDEALMYAIPLSSPYLSRGTAPKSSKLSRKPLSFNFMRMGRGGPVDGWDLGEYSQILRQRYHKSIEEAIEKGDYKKAAYIYAHLLGNLFMAAQTLQNGKHYREAAAIYKDHLKNLTLAAECLEKGGLLAEAIPLYIELGNYEKVGDLHTVLGQEEKARKYYQDTVKRSMEAKDYLNAARLTSDKMHELENGRAILLTGWKDNNHLELCLKKYFDTLNDSGEHLGSEITMVYKDHVSPAKKTIFLNVLADISSEKQDEKLKQNVLDITYEIVQQQVSRGDHSGLKMLGRFLPGDRLISQDCNRFMVQNYQTPKTIAPANSIALRNDTIWLKVVNYHDQVLAIGAKMGELHLARANWEGKTAYEFLVKIPAGHAEFIFGADAALSANVVLGGQLIPLLSEKRMDSYTYFEKEFNLHQINWFGPKVVAYAHTAIHKEIVLLQIENDSLELKNFSLNGRLNSIVSCVYNDEKVVISDFAISNIQMFFRKEHFYFAGEDALFRVNKVGIFEVLSLGSHVIDFSVSQLFAALKVAILTAAGCIIVTPLIKEMNITIGFFAQEMEARFVKLLPDNRLVLANEKLAMVYDIAGLEPKLLCEVETAGIIQAILTVPSRHHFALLEGDGRISSYRIDENL